MPITINDCIHCDEPPMISADWAGRYYIVNCFCYSQPHCESYTAFNAIATWNERNSKGGRPDADAQTEG